MGDDAFDCFGNKEDLGYIAPDTVLVQVGSFADACNLFVGCQCSGATLAATGVWLRELAICSALALARISLDYHQDLLSFEDRTNHGHH